MLILLANPHLYLRKPSEGMTGCSACYDGLMCSDGACCLAVSIEEVCDVRAYPLSDAISEETIRVARAAFPKGNVFMWMHDELGPLYRYPQFAALLSPTG